MLAVVGLAATACTDDPADVAPPTTTPQSTVAPTTTEGPPPEFDIVGTALGATVFSQLAGFVVDAGLVETLRGPGPFTVFAPTDDAFDKIPADIKHAIQDDPDLLVTVLTYHVVPGEIVAADLQEGELETVAGIPHRRYPALSVAWSAPAASLGGACVAACIRRANSAARLRSRSSGC